MGADKKLEIEAAKRDSAAFLENSQQFWEMHTQITYISTGRWNGCRWLRYNDALGLGFGISINIRHTHCENMLRVLYETTDTSCIS